ncbi:MAG: TraR/DksA C4-type zinc finger protein [Fibrobacteria bacterium]|nr:TraR/DksA C4-type zinc finger protein [Fibrobacteria bacterium]
MAKMKKKDLNFFETLLNEKKETLLKELGYYENHSMRVTAKDNSGDLSGVTTHPADQASDSTDTEQAFRLASREGKYLNFLEEALHKVKLGTYGICVACEEIIPKPRLEAVPTAKMCIQCKMAKEEEAKRKNQ